MNFSSYNKKNIYLIAVVAVALSLTALLLFRFSLGDDRAPTSISISPNGVKRDYSKSSVANNSSMEELSRITQGLRKFGEWPISSVQVGRVNPFSPVR